MNPTPVCSGCFNGASASLPRIVRGLFDISVDPPVLQRGLGIAAEDRRSSTPSHRARPSRFNGASASLPRIDLPWATDHRANAASTGPRHRCRGSKTFAAFHCLAIAVLQRGLGIAAEDRVDIQRMMSTILALQRGLGIAAEDRSWRRWSRALGWWLQRGLGIAAEDRVSNLSGSDLSVSLQRGLGIAAEDRPIRRDLRARSRGFNGASASLPRIERADGPA